MQSLRSTLGEMIVVRNPALQKTGLLLVWLHAIDAHGARVEHRPFTNSMVRRFRMASLKMTLVLFVPFQAITFIVSSVYSLSEGAFGLQGDS